MERLWRSGEEIAAVLKMAADGLGATEISATTGIPKHSVINWLRGRIPQRALRELSGEGSCAICGSASHDFNTLPAAAYSYLLGVYLGDGCLWHQGRGVYSLRVALDSDYPGIIGEVVAAIAAVRGRPANVLPDPRGKRYVVVQSYWKQWGCLFPQHGPGRKHSRPIVLAPWQQKIVDAAPEAFLRGLIHTDGWRGLNKVTVKGRDYAYPRYQFSNRSDDIRKLFTDACDALGIPWRPWGRWHISVARRDAVARMDEFVGLKT
jgi:hypothetical protein